jgi:hypothetical protein
MKASSATAVIRASSGGQRLLLDSGQHDRVTLRRPVLADLSPVLSRNCIRAKGIATDPMTRVAYLIKSHRNTSQVERLVRTLVDESPTAEVAIHHNPGGSRVPDVASWGQDRVHLLPNTVSVDYHGALA